MTIKRHVYVWTRRAGIFAANGAAWQIIASLLGYDAGVDELLEALRDWGPGVLVGFVIWYRLRNAESEFAEEAPST
jgi:hypothetical protein